MTGDNLWAAGRAEEDVILPACLMGITVSDDGACSIGPHRFASLDEAIVWLARESGPLKNIILNAESKRVPEEHSLARLCALAVQHNVNLYGRWPVNGDVVDLGSGSPRTTKSDVVWLLVRQTRVMGERLDLDEE